MERNYGIDLLRIISMIMIPMLHILGLGGLLENSDFMSEHYCYLWLLETGAYCAVNCFALISGYVGYSSNFKYANIIYLYIHIVFYNLPASIIYTTIKSGGVIALVTNVAKAMVPICYRNYWYFNSYFCMFFFIPVMNYILQNISKKQLNILMISIIFIFIILPTLFYYDIADSNNGYSTIWLSVMYLLGGYIRKNEINKKYKNRQMFFVYMGCVFVSWSFKLLVENITKFFCGEAMFGDYLIKYTSPTIVMCSISLLILFANINIEEKIRKIISAFASVTFGVYIIHFEPFSFRNVLNDAFVGYLSLSPLFTCLAVLFTAVIVFFTCAVVDYIRLIIFKKLKIKRLCEKIERSISLFFAGMINKCLQK